MRARTAILSGGGILLVVAVFTFWLMYQVPEEVLLANGLELTASWQEIRPGRELSTKGSWSEVLVELTGDEAARATTPATRNSTPLPVEGYLVSAEGELLPLTRTGMVQFNELTFERLSSPALEGRTTLYRFRVLGLRSVPPLKVGRVVWLSYSPADTKTGAYRPRILRP
jgi:hypothetical protein